MKKIAVLASGRGTNFATLAKHIKSGRIKAELVCLISDNPKAKALKVAERFNIPSFVINPKSFESREDFDSAVVGILKEHDVDLVCLAGFMRIVTKVLIEPFRNRIMNIHPSLLPAFKGINAPKKAAYYGVKIAGATVHFVEEDVDSGAVIIQGALPVSPSTSPSELADRILRQIEHRIYPQAVAWFCEGRIKIVGRKVVVEGASYDSLPFVPALEDF